jgi:RNA-binding protein
MLKNIQKKYLKTLAHTKKPIIIIGNNVRTPAVLEEIDKALLFHELIKIKVSTAERVDRDAIIQNIESEMAAELVQRIGHVATFFRANPEVARITLPN